MLIYALLLTAGSRTVHSELLAVHVAMDPNVFPITPPALREEIRQRRASLEAATAPVVQHTCAARLASVRPAYAAMLEQRARRERAIVESRPSSARQLVQAGLFDRRAARTADARLRTDGALFAQAEDLRISPTGAAIGCSAELRAILVVDRQDRRRED